jgi:hypothetical protein
MIETSNTGIITTNSKDLQSNIQHVYDYALENDYVEYSSYSHFACYQ